jgi:hypothetical protein
VFVGRSGISQHARNPGGTGRARRRTRTRALPPAPAGRRARRDAREVVDDAFDQRIARLTTAVCSTFCVLATLADVDVGRRQVSSASSAA